MNLVWADAGEDAVARQGFADGRFDAGQAQADRGSIGEVGDLADLRRTLGVDEVDPLAVQDDSGKMLVRLDHLADPVLESVGGGEEQPAVEPDHGDSGELLAVWMLVEFAEDLGAGLASQHRHGRVGGYRDQPEQRQADPDHHSGEHAEDQGAHDRRDCDPEVESRHVSEPAHLLDVHHALHDRLDDECGEYGFGKIGEQRSEYEQGEQHGRTGGE